MTEKYVRKSIVKSEILPSEYEYITDDKNEYPELFEGENKVISYGKKGLISQGNIIKLINDKPVSYSLIRRDKYKPTKTIIIKGTAPKDKE